MAELKPHVVGSVGDFPEGQMVPRQVAGHGVVLVRRQGGVLCFLDECPHQPVKLSEFGEVQGSRLVCHAHGGTFDLDHGGRVLCAPPLEGLRCLRTLEVDGQVSVFI
jgi:nitrite reductase/ring-hydroxylating ferredoxin subunit